MKRLSIGGASLVSPVQSEAELKSILSNLGVARTFDEAGVHELYLRIGRIIGAWRSEQESKEVQPVAKALLSVARHLTDASELLSGHDTGLRSRKEIEVTSQTAKFLALDPAVGSLTKAHELISAFHREAAWIGHVCMVAYADLANEAGQGGRPALEWYDGFTALLLEIADKAGVAPTQRKDRSSGARSGWLFEAAQALESFLDPWMRSPSAEACGKRLERSRRRLNRQIPRAR